MDRSDVLLVGLGGAGGNLVDTIVNKNPMFECLFINTSITDIQSLTNSNEEVENFYCISKINGVGRDRTKGKAFAKQRGLNILDTISRYNQKKIYLVTSFGGGSGSSILSVLTEGIDKFIANGEEFDKDIESLSNETGEVSEEEKQSFKEKFAEGFNKTKDSVSNLFSKFGNNKDKIKTDPIEEIKKYKELLDSGIINQEEFDKKKKELLNL